MRRLILVFCLAVVCAGGMSSPSAGEPPGSPDADEAAAGTPYGDYVIGVPVSHENLTIFPILSKTAKNDDRFITLDEGLAAGTVSVIEIGADATGDSDGANAGSFERQLAARQRSVNQVDPDNGNNGEEADDESLFGPALQESAEQETETPAEAENSDDLFGTGESEDLFGADEIAGDVNTLMVLNTSGKPLYLMPGEVISGGKQDRTIGQEVVIASADKPVPIDVFCVEHGRWAGRSVAGTAAQLTEAAEFSPNLSLVVSQSADVEELAREAERGKFVASVGQLNKDARLAVQEAGMQDKVWDEVAKTNTKLGNASDSGNFAASYYSGEIAKDFEPFIETIKPAGERKQIVGVAVAVNGKMLSVDLFESTPLFKKFWPKLLKSYALDAVAANAEKESRKSPKTIAVEECVAFLKDIERSNTETEKLADRQRIDKRESKLGTSFSYYDAEAARAAGVSKDEATKGYGGGFGGAVHTSVLAK